MNKKIVSFLKVTVGFATCSIPIGLSLVFPTSLVTQISSLALLLAPGYLIMMCICNGFELNARSIACFLALSVGLLYTVTLLDLYALRQFPFRLAFFLAILIIYVFAARRSISGVYHPSSGPLLKLSAEKIILIMLALLMVIVFTLALLNTRFDCLADNDGYGYVSTGKALFSQGSNIIKWQDLRIDWSNILRWEEGKYQPLYIGVDRIGFVLLEGSFGEFAGSTTTSGQILALFFYVLLPVATYLVATLIMRRRSALIAACLVDFIPYMMWHSNRILTEIPMTVFALLSMYFLYEYVQKKKPIDMFLFFLTFLFSLFIKPMAIFLIVPFIIFVSLSLFKGESQIGRTRMAFWIILWSLPFVGSIFLTRFRVSGSFRGLLSSLLNILTPGSSFITNVQNNFSPMFLTPTILILGLIGIPYMFTRKNWKPGAMVFMSMISLTWLIAAIGLMEPREAIIVYPLIVVAAASFFDTLELGNHVKTFFFALLIVGIFFVYQYYSLHAPILLSQGFTITQSEAMMQMEISWIAFSLLTLLIVIALYRRKNGSPLTLGKRNLSSKIWLGLKYAMIALCISLILLQGFFGTEALIESGTWSNISLRETGLSDAADYINNYTSGKGVLLTTLMASAPLNYLTSAKTLQPPPTLSDFYLSLQKHEFDYLVLTPKSPIIWLPRPEYMERFRFVPPVGMHEIYRDVRALSVHYDFNDSNSLLDWNQFNPVKSAIIEGKSLKVGGEADSGIVSGGVFRPELLNITCSVDSLSDPFHSPQVSWNNGVDYITTYFQDDAWILESHVNGNLSYIRKEGRLELGSTYNLTLLITPESASAFVNDRLIGTQHYDLITFENSHIIIKSTYYADGTISDATIMESQTMLVVYARDGVH